MIGILVVTHGDFGKQLVKSAELILGSQSHYETLGLFHGDNIDQFGQRIMEKIKSLDDGDGVLAFVDLYGGSPFNAITLNFKKLTAKYKLQCITGVNLPMILEAFSSRQFCQIEELKKCCLDVGKKGIKDITEQLNSIEMDVKTN